MVFFCAPFQAPDNSALAANTTHLRSVSTRQPSVLNISPEVLWDRIEMLKGRGFPIPINRTPTVLRLLPPTVERKLRLLTSLGFDATAVARRGATLVTRSEQAIRDHVAFLEGSGLDAVRILTACPTVLSCHIDRKLRPIIEFVTRDMGRALKDINTCPRCLITSLAQRLRPRHEYMAGALPRTTPLPPFPDSGQSPAVNRLLAGQDGPRNSLSPAS